MQPYAHDEAAISAPGLAKRAAWAGSIAAVRQMPTGPMLRCILLAAAAHAFPASDAERTAFTYLINGTEPADGLLEVDAAAAASAHVGMLANSGRIAPNDAALCADARAGRACPRRRGALQQRGAAVRRDLRRRRVVRPRGDVRAGARRGAGPRRRDAELCVLPGATRRPARRGPRAAAGRRGIAADGGAYGAAGIRVMAASLCQPHVRRAKDAPARYARLLRRLEDLAVDLEQQDIQGDARSLVGNMPIAWPYLGYAFYPSRRG